MATLTKAGRYVYAVAPVRLLPRLRAAFPAFSPAPRKSGLWRGARAFLAPACLFALVGCFYPAARVPAAEPAVKWNLSPEAEHVYYYLLLSEAMYQNNDRLAGEALQGLLRHDTALPIFQDGATILLAGGDFKAAVEVCRRGLALYPGDEQLTVLLAGSLSESGRDDEAVQGLEAHLKAKPGHNEVRQELIRLYLKIGSPEKALELLDKNTSDTQSAQAMLFRARVLAGAGKDRDAAGVLKTLVRKFPEYAQAWIEAALLAERNGRFYEALEAYKRAAELMPESLDLWYRIIALQLKDKKPRAAVQTLNRVPDQGAFRLQAALLFADEGYNKEALDLIQEAAKGGADPDEAAYYRSIVEFRISGDAEGALALLRSIPPKSPLYVRAKLREANILLDAERFADAEKVVAEARKQSPDTKEFWGVEAYALVRQNRTADAEKLMEEALKLYPEDEDILFSLGHIQSEAGNKDAAVAVMERVIAKNPRHAKALNYIGYTLAEENKNLPRALELVNRALAVTPDEDYIVDSLAWVQYRMGHFEDAWKSIRRCIELGGDDPTIWEHYGDIALALKKKTEALKGWNEALKRNPTNADDIHQKIKNLSK